MEFTRVKKFELMAQRMRNREAGCQKKGNLLNLGKAQLLSNITPGSGIDYLAETADRVFCSQFQLFFLCLSFPC